MIFSPQNAQQYRALADFIRERAHVQASADTQYLAWVDPGGQTLKMVVAMNGFLGKTCQIHVAMRDDFNFTPRKLLEAVFDYTFNTARREMLIGVVNSKNEAAMRYDKHLGFVESHRYAGMHDDGGDLVIFTMTRAQCRYLKSPAKVKEAA
jgi:RimJ/RimL family protein N-acetyltransferase